MHKEHNSNKWNIHKVLNRQWLLSSLENTTDVMRLMTRRMTTPPIILEPIHLSGSSWSPSFSPSQTANYHVLQILHPQKDVSFSPSSLPLSYKITHACSPEQRHNHLSVALTPILPHFNPFFTIQVEIGVVFLKKHKFSHVSALYSICNHP